MGHFRVLPQDAVLSDDTGLNGLMRAAPNPASTLLDLTLDRALGMGTVTITDITGRGAMMRKDVSGFLRLDVQRYLPGSYLITFRGAAGTSMVRFVRS